MSGPVRYDGVAVSEGTAVGLLYQAEVASLAVSVTPARLRTAFAEVAAERTALAERLRAAGRGSEADIVAVAALIAADPILINAALAALSTRATQPDVDAVAAIGRAVAEQAAVIAAIEDPELAERAGEVRQVGSAVLSRLVDAAVSPPTGDFILVGREVAAAELIELAERGLVGAASVLGGASSHAAIVARGLGIPMITAVDPAILAETAGHVALVNTELAELVVDPGEADLAALTRLGAVGRSQDRPTTPPQDRPTAQPLDGSLPRSQWSQYASAGRRVLRGCPAPDVKILCNVASAAETRRGLADGAAGVGLLRTEIPFTGARDWPTQAEHLAQLAPILELLTDRATTVRLLDFSGDKIPPFLPGGQDGLTALLRHPTALAWQLRAVLTAGQRAELAILVPMVSSLAQVSAVNEAIGEIAADLGVRRPRLGIMVELDGTATAAQRFAPHVDFFSIGTNDLAGQVLGLDRRDQAATPGLAADPRVLTLIDHVVGAARAAGIEVSVCGDSAADAGVLPLLVGLGVRTISVPAARVARVASWISAMDPGACAALAAQSLRASDIAEVADLVQHARLS